MTDASGAIPPLPVVNILFPESTYGNVLQHVVDTARECISGASMAGMTLLDRFGPTTAVATSVAAQRVDEIQYEFNSGPCLDAYRRQVINKIDSTETDERWPEFCRGAFKEGIRSTLSLPLVINGDGIGALNLYSQQDSGFDELDERIGIVFGAHASITLANARSYWQIDALRHNLEEALQTRGIIDQAKGVLMAREGYNADEAFEVLKRASQRSNRKVHELAREVVENTRHEAGPKRH